MSIHATSPLFTVETAAAAAGEAAAGAMSGWARAGRAKAVAASSAGMPARVHVLNVMEEGSVKKRMAQSASASVSPVRMRTA